jgi:hypothetical protein
VLDVAERLAVAFDRLQMFLTIDETLVNSLQLARDGQAAPLGNDSPATLSGVDGAFFWSWRGVCKTRPASTEPLANLRRMSLFATEFRAASPAPCADSLGTSRRLPLDELSSQSSVTCCRRFRQIVCVLNSEGVATLQGRLPSWHLKQLAQTFAQKAPGVRLVINRIEVIEGESIPRAGDND